MKKIDILFLLFLTVIVLPFVLFKPASDGFMFLTINHPYLMAFLKFAVLATIGEMIGLRIKEGVYSFKGFGLLPRAILWGLFGIWIALSMKVMAVGAPVMVESFGIKGVVQAMKESFTCTKLIGAFAISLMLNTIFAPVFMTLHKITDTHIVENGGKLSALLKPIPMKRIIKNLNWEVQWGFIFKKTIPLFWIPAHTITFLLPPLWQVLFAAILGIVLGVFLSIAAVMSRRQ